jgi:hypothetical protein
MYRGLTAKADTVHNVEHSVLADDMGFRSGDREQVFAQLDVSCRPKYIQISDLI